MSSCGVCLSAPGPVYVPPCQGQVLAWVVILGVLVLVRVALLVDTLLYWTRRRARQIKRYTEDGDVARLRQARRRLPLMPAVVFAETLVYIAFLGVPFWIADPLQRGTAMVSLMGGLTFLFYFAGAVAVRHYVNLGKAILGVSDAVLASAAPESERKFEILRELDAWLKVVFAAIVVLLAAMLIETVPVNLAVAGPRDTLLVVFYCIAAATAVLVQVAMQYQLYRLDDAVAGAQRAPGDAASKAVYGPVRARLWYQRAGMSVLSPGLVLYLLAAVGVIDSLYLLVLVMAPIEVVLKALTVLLFRPVKHWKPTTGMTSSSEKQSGSVMVSNQAVATAAAS